MPDPTPEGQFNRVISYHSEDTRHHGNEARCNIRTENLPNGLHYYKDGMNK